MADVSTEHKDYKIHRSEWVVMRDFMNGEEAVKTKRQTYLPKTPGMVLDKQNGDDRYNNYLKIAPFPDLTRTVIQGAQGLIHRKQSEIKVPEAMEMMESQATPKGLNLDATHRHVTKELLTTSRLLIVVELRDTTEGPRPVLIPVKAEDLINWKTDTIDGMVKPTLVVFKDSMDASTDQYETKSADVLVEYALDEQELAVCRKWVKGESGTYSLQEETEPKQNGKRMAWLPVVFGGAENRDAEVETPIFYSLAKAATTIFQLSADYRQAMRYYEPTPVITGVTPVWKEEGESPQTLGSGSAWLLPEGADAKLLEYTGPAIANMRLALNDAKSEAAQAAARPFAPNSNQVESAKAKIVRQGQASSAIIELALNSAETLEMALKMAADWIGADPDEVSVPADTELAERMLDAPTMATLLSMWLQGAISKETFHYNLKRGGVTQMGFEEEEQAIEDEGLKTGLESAEPDDGGDEG